MVRRNIEGALRKLGIKITRHRNFLDLAADSQSLVFLRKKLDLLRALKTQGLIDDSEFVDLIEVLQDSKSQNGQDLMALAISRMSVNGYFVEFGACDGLILSNTFLLEKQFAWGGILAEPALNYRSQLSQNRKCSIDFSFVSKENATVRFTQAIRPELSSASKYSELDFHAKERKGGSEYFVPSISLLELLKKHRAPSKIDFLSIDVEGGEWDVISGFDFNEYEIKFISAEHNFSRHRNDVAKYLSKFGYRRIFQEYSGVDDWFVSQT